MSANEFIPAKSGRTFCISAYKPPGRPGYVSATEGDIEGEIFTTALFSDLRIVEPVVGLSTQKNIAQARERLLARLRKEGLIE